MRLGSSIRRRRGPGKKGDSGKGKEKKAGWLSGLLAELRRREHFEKPSIGRKRKKAAKKRNAAKAARKMSRRR